MATINGDSTTAEVRKAYDDNASYFEDDSVSKARAFVTACSILIRREYNTMNRGPNSMGKNVDLLKQERKDAVAFIRERDSSYRGPNVIQATFRNSRRGA